jgi:hypothetical protein
VEAEIKTGLVGVEATDLEASPKEKEAVAEQQEVASEEPTVETIKALKDRSGDQRLAIRHRGRPKKWTKGIGGSQQKLAVTCGRLSRGAFPAPPKGHGCQGPGRDSIAVEPLKDGCSRGDDGCARNAAVE